jgi:uncharacterized coiled-coil DUF342 family protein
MPTRTLDDLHMDIVSIRNEIESLRKELKEKTEAIGGLCTIIFSLIISAPGVQENIELKNKIAELEKKLH